MELERRGYALHEFEQLFSLGRGTAKRLVRRGLLATIYIGGRRIVPAAEVDRVASQGIGNGTKRGGKGGRARR